jgi:cellulose synthase (UDP-forming)
MCQASTNKWIRKSILALVAAYSLQYSLTAFAASKPDVQESTQTKQTNKIQATSAGALKRIVTFSQLNNDEPIELHRTFFEKQITFSYPRALKQQPGSVLVLNVAHSPGLLPRLSSLAVSVNGVLLKTFMLDADTVSPSDLVIPLDKVQLKDFNQLSIKAVQHYTLECEDQFSSLLWTVVNPSSHFVFEGQPRGTALNLQNWPFPFIDTQDVEQNKIVFAPLSKPTAETLRSLSRVAVNLGALSDYRDIETEYSNNLTGKVVAIGTPAENQLASSLGAILPLPIKSGKFVDETGKVIDDQTGVLELVRTDSGAIVLVVGGNSPQAVEKAATALVREDLNPIVGGAAALVEKIEGKQPANYITRTGQIPNTKSFSFAELGYLTTSVHGLDPPPITVEADTTPGIAAMGTSQRLQVVFGYGAQANNDLSSFEVRMNGISLRSYALSKPEGEERHEDIVEIRNNLFKEKNKFEFVFHLYPKSMGQCAPKVDQQLWGTLYDGTRLNLDREYVTGLPNLKLLNNFGFPFAKNANLNDLTIVLPEEANNTVVSALAKISVLFGKWADAPESNIHVAMANAVDDDARKTNLIVFSPGGTNAIQKSLGDALTLNDRDKTLRILKASGNRNFLVNQVDPNGYMEECISPWNSAANVLVLSGSSPAAFGLAVNALMNTDLRFKLAGSVASISPEDVVKTVQASPIIESTTMTPLRKLTLAFSQQGWLAPVVLVLLLIFLLPRLLRALKPKPAVVDDGAAGNADERSDGT